MSKNIDQITNTISTILGTMRFVLRQGTAGVDATDGKATIATLATYMSSGVLDDYVSDYIEGGALDTYINGLLATSRRGTIQIWGKATAPTGALLCDGTAYNGTANPQYAALYAIIGNTFGGTSIADFKVPNFQGVVPKGTGSQTINTRSKSGPALGAVEEDQGQGHWHGFMYSGQALAAPGSSAIGFASGNDGYSQVQEPRTDGVNGTPRTGATTRDNSLGVNFIIWY